MRKRKYPTGQESSHRRTPELLIANALEIWSEDSLNSLSILRSTYEFFCIDQAEAPVHSVKPRIRHHSQSSWRRSIAAGYFIQGVRFCVCRNAMVQRDRSAKCCKSNIIGLAIIAPNQLSCRIVQQRTTLLNGTIYMVQLRA
jgi:hypothetical protein